MKAQMFKNTIRYVVFNRGVNEGFTLVVELLEAVPVRLRAGADNIIIIL